MNVRHIVISSHTEKKKATHVVVSLPLVRLCSGSKHVVDARRSSRLQKVQMMTRWSNH